MGYTINEHQPRYYDVLALCAPDTRRNSRCHSMCHFSIITGPVGVGKTTVAGEVSEHSRQQESRTLLWTSTACAGVIRGPRTIVSDPARDAQSRVPVAQLSRGWRHAPVAADVIESRAELRRFETAIPQARITVVRLRASVEVLWQRVAQRELGSGRDWHLRRAAELAAQMERDAVEDLLVGTDGQSHRRDRRRNGAPHLLDQLTT